MAGKSTVMRSLCAVAVLSACGLYAPIAAATVPYTDAFMLRTFSADSPLEGKSSFAIEMTEMRCVSQRQCQRTMCGGEVVIRAVNRQRGPERGI